MFVCPLRRGKCERARRLPPAASQLLGREDPQQSSPSPHTNLPTFIMLCNLSLFSFWVLHDSSFSPKRLYSLGTQLRDPPPNRHQASAELSRGLRSQPAPVYCCLLWGAPVYCFRTLVRVGGLYQPSERQCTTTKLLWFSGGLCFSYCHLCNTDDYQFFCWKFFRWLEKIIM